MATAYSKQAKPAGVITDATAYLTEFKELATTIPWLQTEPWTVQPAQVTTSCLGKHGHGNTVAGVGAVLRVGTGKATYELILPPLGGKAFHNSNPNEIVIKPPSGGWWREAAWNMPDLAHILPAVQMLITVGAATKEYGLDAMCKCSRGIGLKPEGAGRGVYLRYHPLGLLLGASDQDELGKLHFKRFYRAEPSFNTNCWEFTTESYYFGTGKEVARMRALEPAGDVTAGLPGKQRGMSLLLLAAFVDLNRFEQPMLRSGAATQPCTPGALRNLLAKLHQDAADTINMTPKVAPVKTTNPGVALGL